MFVSYTTNEDEVRIVKPIVDRFLNEFLRPVIASTIGEPPVFYDGYSLYHPSDGRWIPPPVLDLALRFAIEESEILLAFVSPNYATSRWCRFECYEMAGKKRRPWFDLDREPPIAQLRDMRSSSHRPGWWERRRIRTLMRRWRLTAGPQESGGVIMPILWKGKMDSLEKIPELETSEWMDWRSCANAAETSMEVESHRAIHGSVSPSLEEEAESLRSTCRHAMTATADTVAKILQQRRSDYASRTDG